MLLARCYVQGDGAGRPGPAQGAEGSPQKREEPPLEVPGSPRPWRALGFRILAPRSAGENARPPCLAAGLLTLGNSSRRD